MRPEPKTLEMKMPMLDDLYPTKYLSSADVKAAGGTIIDTIEAVQLEELNSNRGKQLKPVIYLQSQTKGVVCNKTNAVRLATFLGSRNTDDWVKARVEIGVEQVQSIGGGLTDGIRFQDARKLGLRAAALVQQQQPTMPPKQNGEGVAQDIDDGIPF
jgi:hypothetical protein